MFVIKSTLCGIRFRITKGQNPSISNALESAGNRWILAETRRLSFPFESRDIRNLETVGFYRFFRLLRSGRILRYPTPWNLLETAGFWRKHGGYVFRSNPERSGTRKLLDSIGFSVCYEAAAHTLHCQPPSLEYRCAECGVWSSPRLVHVKVNVSNRIAVLLGGSQPFRPGLTLSALDLRLLNL